MPGQSLVMFLSVLAIAIASNRADESKNITPMNGPAVRGPASLHAHKGHDHYKRDLVKHTHKVRGPLSVEVELVGAKPERAGDVFVLKGIVRAEGTLENVEFAWRLPAGVEVVNGQMSSEIAIVSEGKPFETQITLRQETNANARVTLRVRGQEDGSRFGDAAAYHTLEQEKLEAARAELRASNEALLKSQKIFDEAPVSDQKQFKVYH